MSTKKRINYAEVEKLYQQGLNDREIAKCIGTRNHTIYEWRRRNNLPHNIKRIDHIEALKLYQQGLNDREIAKCIGTNNVSIYSWRKRNNLQPNGIFCEYGIRINEKIAFKMYVEGATDPQIAKALNVDVKLVSKWRRYNALPSNYKKNNSVKIQRIIKNSSKVPVKGNESLYCDSEFLSKFFNKDIKGGC